MTEKKRVCDNVSIITKHGKEVYQFDAYIHGQRIQKQIGVVGKEIKTYIKAYSQRLYNELLNAPLKRTRGEIKDVRFDETVELFFNILEKQPYKITEKTRKIRPNYVRDHRNSAKNLLKRFAGKMIRQIKKDDVLDYMYHRRLNRTQSTVNKEVIFLKLLWKLLVREGYLQENLMDQIKLPKPDNTRTVVFNEDEFNLMLKNCNGDKAHLKPILIIAALTGMRKNELLSLRYDRIDFDSKVVHLAETKSGVAQDVYLCDAAIEELSQMRSMAKDKKGFIFLYHGKQIKDVKTAFRKLLKECGLEGKGYRFHDTRSFFCTELIKRGTNVEAVRNLARHKDVNTTIRYVRMTESDLNNAVNAMNNVFKANR